jgi:hypothetical protein
MFDRAHSLLNPRETFGQPAVLIGRTLDLEVPKTPQMILRMMIRNPFSQGFQIPKELDWLRTVILACDTVEKTHGVENPYVYVTVRHGIVNTVTDDLWHVDGFSMRMPHVPEHNYIWADVHPTEILDQWVTLPHDFDPMRHNIHHYFQDVADESNTCIMRAEHIYAIDPYVIHRRPSIPAGTQRTFFRVSFIPVEIEDDTCHVNPLIPREKPYGREDIRHRLERYPVDNQK